MVDVVVGLVVAVFPLVFEALDAGEVGATLDPVDFVASVIAFALIVLRRHAPIPVFAVALVAAVGSLVPVDDQPVMRAAAWLALYTIASTSDRRTAWSAGLVAAVALIVTATVKSSGPWYGGDNLELIAWTGVAIAAGDAVRSRRAVVLARHERAVALEERARRAEQALEEESRRQVAEERLRIARELHDVVAHHIAVINVQAGVATHLMGDDPAAAEQALAHVRDGAARVLDELGAILSVMRSPSDPAPSTDPLPTIGQLDELVGDFDRLGLDIEWHTAGARRPVPPAIGLAAYRIVQESLTNAHRHGTGRHVQLRVDYQPHAIAIDVVNNAAAASASTSPRGHGTIGMRERVAAAGGTIKIGPTGDGRFGVHATLPLDGDVR